MIGQLRRERRSHYLFHVLVWTVGVIAVFLILQRLSAVLYPVGLALLIAYLLNPSVSRLERAGLPRTLAIMLILFGAVVVVWVIVLMMIPLVASDLDHFSKTVPKAMVRLSHSIIPWLQHKLGIPVPDSLTEALRRSGLSAGQVAAKLSTALLPALGITFATVPRLLRTILFVILVPVFSYYFLGDFPRMTKGVKNLIPPRFRKESDSMIREIGAVVSGWVRGQLVVMSVLAVLYATGLWFCDIPLAIPVGLLAGLLTFIPYIGTAIGLVLALLMVVLDYSTSSLAGVLAVFAALHLLESLVLTPSIVGKRVGIGEAGALIAILVGEELLGFVGVMIAVPTAAVVMVVLRHARNFYLASDFYLRDAEPPPEPVPLAVVLEHPTVQASDGEGAP